MIVKQKKWFNWLSVLPIFYESIIDHDRFFIEIKRDIKNCQHNRYNAKKSTKIILKAIINQWEILSFRPLIIFL